MTEETKQPETPETWAIVELMGHVKLAGRLTEEEKFGSKLGRLDVPLGDGFHTKYFGGGSVYRISLVTEAVARIIADMEEDDRRGDDAEFEDGQENDEAP